MLGVGMDIIIKIFLLPMDFSPAESLMCRRYHRLANTSHPSLHRICENSFLRSTMWSWTLVTETGSISCTPWWGSGATVRHRAEMTMRDGCGFTRSAGAGDWQDGMTPNKGALVLLANCDPCDGSHLRL